MLFSTARRTGLDILDKFCIWHWCRSRITACRLPLFLDFWVWFLGISAGASYTVVASFFLHGAHITYICYYNNRINGSCLVQNVNHEKWGLEMQASMTLFDACIHWHHSSCCFNVAIYLRCNAMNTYWFPWTYYFVLPFSCIVHGIIQQGSRIMGLKETAWMKCTTRASDPYQVRSCSQRVPSVFPINKQLVKWGEPEKE